MLSGHPEVTEGFSFASLAKRPFAARVELVGEVDIGAEPVSKQEHVADVEKLRDGVAADQ
jgi:hypothetical protein